MNPEIKEQWVAALRSGDYARTVGRLRRENNTYCCLGVLCDLAVKAGVVSWGLIEYSPYPVILSPDGGYEEYSLPMPVRQWAELEEDNPVIHHPVVSLIAANDSDEMPFEEIAALVEQYL